MTISIQRRIALWAGTSLLATVAALTGIGLWQFGNASDQLHAKSAESTAALAQDYLAAAARQEALAISRKLDAAMHHAQALAAMAGSLRQAEAVTDKRGVALAMMRDLLAQQTSFLGVYTGFEADAFDGADATSIGAPGSDAASGRFLPYLVRTASGISVDLLIDMDNQTPNAFGVRAGEYYLCPKDSLSPCVIDPYLYPIDGKQVLITSLVTPIVEGGQFLGIAGVDLSIEFVQSLTQEASSNLYGGEATVSVLSPLGIVAGHSEQPDAVSKLFSQVDLSNGAEIEAVVKSGKNAHLVDGEDMEVIVPFRIGDATAPWAVYVSVPKAVVMAQIAAQEQLTQESQVSFTWYSILSGAVISAVGILLMWTMATSITRPIRSMAALVRNIAQGEGDLTQQIRVEREDELGELAGHFNQFIQSLRTMVQRMMQTGEQISRMSDQGDQVASNTSDLVGKQQEAIEQVVTAVTEMASASNEVAQSAARAAESAKSADLAADDGRGVVRETAESVNQLAQRILSAKQVIESLEQNSEQIISILSVIQGIAEQTNLLALNAAIEAARAGEAGRGFAVVADEVRALAGRTREATDDIRQMIDTLQKDSKEAAYAMSNSVAGVQNTVQMAQRAADALGQIKTAIESINHMNIQIAAATEEQSLVSEDVNQNVSHISEFARTASDDAKQLKQVNQALQRAARDLFEQFSKFKV